MQPALPQSIVRSSTEEETTRLRSGTTVHTILPSAAVEDTAGAWVGAASGGRVTSPLGRVKNTTAAATISTPPADAAQIASRRLRRTSSNAAPADRQRARDEQHAPPAP